MQADRRLLRFRHLTPSLLLCLGATWLPAQEKEPLEKRVNDALTLSRPALLQHLRAASGGQLALLCLAAAHDAVPTTNKVFAAAIKRLRKTKLTQTYDLSLRLMLMTNLRNYPERRSAAARDAKRLLMNQTQGGGFSYGLGKGGKWDLSNTQYAALGLRAAANLGFKIPMRCWKSLAAATITAQGDDGGFGYSTARAGRVHSTASMTVAGIAVLQICGQHLPSKTVADLELPERIEHGWDWMAEHKSDIGDRATRNCFYFHYGLERACILSEVKEIDGKDWYRSGAEMFVRLQLRGGGWFSTVDTGGGAARAGAGNPVSTAFAILFLRRKFQKLLSPITPGGGIRVANLGQQATKKTIEDAIAAEVRRGVRVVPDLIKSLHSPIDVRRKAALRALIRITGKDFGYNPHQPPARNAEALKRIELWWLKNRNPTSGK
ncbi:MAG: prenyltransferase/squalene oxidase repeat-containing protein [Planctomycetota bacterium]